MSPLCPGAAEAGGAPPENPSVFWRLVNTLVAHNRPMVCPKISGDFDYEGELALIIGKPGRHITKHNAMSHVFGYTCFNDGSIRDKSRRAAWCIFYLAASIW